MVRVAWKKLKCSLLSFSLSLSLRFYSLCCCCEWSLRSHSVPFLLQVSPNLALLILTHTRTRSLPMRWLFDYFAWTTALARQPHSLTLSLCPPTSRRQRQQQRQHRPRLLLLLFAFGCHRYFASCDPVVYRVVVGGCDSGAAIAGSRLGSASRRFQCNFGCAAVLVLVSTSLCNKTGQQNLPSARLCVSQCVCVWLWLCLSVLLCARCNVSCRALRRRAPAVNGIVVVVVAAFRRKRLQLRSFAAASSSLSLSVAPVAVAFTSFLRIFISVSIFLFFFFVSRCLPALLRLFRAYVPHTQLLWVGCHLNIKAKCEDDSFPCPLPPL